MNLKTRFEYASETFLILKANYRHKISKVVGDVIRTLCQYGFGWIGESNDLQVYSALKSIESPTGAFLDSMVASLPMTSRKSATTAKAKVLFVVGDSVTTPVTVVSGTQVRASEAGVDFKTDADVTLTRSAYIDCSCVRSGSIGNVPAYAIDTLRTSITGIETVYNTESASGGSDQEDDIALNSRRKAFYDSLARGTVAALEYGAKEVSGVVYAGCRRSYPAVGECTVAIGDGNGNATTELIESVAANLESGGSGVIKGYVAAGATVHVTNFIRYLIQTTYTVGVSTGYSLGSVKPSIQSANDSFIKSLGPGSSIVNSALGQNVKDNASGVDHVYSVSCAYVTMPQKLPITITGFSGELWETSTFEWNYSGTSLRWEGGDWVQVQPYDSLFNPVVTFANAEKTAFITAIVSAWAPGNSYPKYSMDEIIYRGTSEKYLSLEKNEFPLPSEVVVMAEGLTSA